MVHGGHRQEGPLKNFLDIADTYSLLPIIEQAIEMGTDVSLHSWKKRMKMAVTYKDEQEWAVKANMYPSLKRLSVNSAKLTVNGWWLFVQRNPSCMYKCRCIMKLYLDVHHLNTHVHKFGKCNTNSLCHKCDENVPDTIEHMLFDCVALEDTRKTLWEQVICSCPSSILAEQILSMPLCERATFMLSCLGNGYIEEWTDLYTCIVNFIYRLYVTSINITHT